VADLCYRSEVHIHEYGRERIVQRWRVIWLEFSSIRSYTENNSKIDFLLRHEFCLLLTTKAAPSSSALTASDSYENNKAINLYFLMIKV